MITSNAETTRIGDDGISIDFVNTLDWRLSDHPINLLSSYQVALDWALDHGVITTEEGLRFGSYAATHPAEAEAACNRGVDLREAIYHLYEVSIRDAPFNAKDLELLNDWLVQAAPHLRLVRGEPAYTWQWDADDKDGAQLERIFWPVALIASQLLTSDDQVRLGQCADERGCGGVFIDTSRNHTRRWCSMNDCGNRAKSRRHYARVKLQEN